MQVYLQKSNIGGVQYDVLACQILPQQGLSVACFGFNPPLPLHTQSFDSVCIAEPYSQEEEKKEEKESDGKVPSKQEIFRKVLFSVDSRHSNAKSDCLKAILVNEEKILTKFEVLKQEPDWHHNRGMTLAAAIANHADKGTKLELIKFFKQNIAKNSVEVCQLLMQKELDGMTLAHHLIWDTHENAAKPARKLLNLLIGLVNQSTPKGNEIQRVVNLLKMPATAGKTLGHVLVDLLDKDLVIRFLDLLKLLTLKGHQQAVAQILNIRDITERPLAHHIFDTGYYDSQNPKDIKLAFVECLHGSEKQSQALVSLFQTKCPHTELTLTDYFLQEPSSEASYQLLCSGVLPPKEYKKFAKQKHKILDYIKRLPEEKPQQKHEAFKNALNKQHPLHQLLKARQSFFAPSPTRGVYKSFQDEHEKLLQSMPKPSQAA